MAKRRDRCGSDILRTRLMLRPVILVSGEDAVRLLYDPDLLKRAGVMPRRIWNPARPNSGFVMAAVRAVN